MAMPSEQDIQEQIRQSQQLVGFDPSSQQQPFQSMGPAGNYAPFIPQAPFQLANAQNNTKAKGVPVNMGKVSLLGISFSLMLLGAFTFLGGFLLGIWVAGPRVTAPMVSYFPAQQNAPYYPTGTSYPQGAEAYQGANAEQNMGRQIGSAIEAAIKEPHLPHLPAVLSPLIRAAQSEIGRQAGKTAEDILKQQLSPMPAAPQRHIAPSSEQLSPMPVAPQRHVAPSPAFPGETYAPQPSEPTQLPVITPPSQAPAMSFAPVSQENEGGYAVQLGVYASLENANSLVNRLQALNQQSHLAEGKAPDGTRIYYVYSGLYKDYTAAQNAAAQYASQNIPGAIIVRSTQQHKNPL